jgi:hypothetical protein
LEHNGVLLSKHYSNPFILRDLIDLGDISSLRPTVGTKHAFSRLEVPMDGEAYDKLYGEMTTFYGRDRGEEGTMQKTFKNFADYKENHQYEEYEYILREVNGTAVWFVADHCDTYMPLTEVLSKCNVEECVA